MTCHMSLRMKVITALQEELAMDEPSDAVLQACHTALKKIDEAGHAKTFAMMSDPERYEK